MKLSSVVFVVEKRKKSVICLDEVLITVDHARLNYLLFQN